jgi:CMP-N-acetylneuraminic acid synthetase
MCVVAARAGSKGLPGKNVRLFAGKPLLAHSVEQAVRSGVFDCVAVSSESPEYLEVGRAAGATLLLDRPGALAADDTPKMPVLRHALEAAERHLQRPIEVLVDLQPTSPLRRPEDIAGAVAHLEANPSFANVVSVSAAKASPYYTIVEPRPDGTIVLSKPLPRAFDRRQDAPEVFALNGSIYAWRRDAIMTGSTTLTERTGYWVLPAEYSADIDTQLDFDIAAFIAERYLGWPATPR